MFSSQKARPYGVPCHGWSAKKSDRDQGISVGGRTSDENWVGPTVDDGLLISVMK